MTATGTTLDNPNMDEQAWARGAAAKNSGKIIPPGNFPAQARAMASSFAIPTCVAAATLVNGNDGLTRATLISSSDSPCFVAENAVCWPSIMH